MYIYIKYIYGLYFRIAFKILNYNRGSMQAEISSNKLSFRERDSLSDRMCQMYPV